MIRDERLIQTLQLLADRHDLGALRKLAVYKKNLFLPGYERILTGCSGLYLSLVGGLLICGIALSLSVNTNAVPIPGIVGSFLLGCFVFYLIILSISTFQGREKHIHLYAYGCIIHRGKKAEVVRWDQIRAIYHQEYPRLHRYSIASSHRYIIQSQDGRKFAIQYNSGAQKDLGVIVKEEVNALLVPQALERFKSGDPQLFGALRLQLQGLSKFGDAQGIIPWSNVSITASPANTLKIKKRDTGELWYRCAAMKVPNLVVLTALLRYVRYGQEEWRQDLCNDFFYDRADLL